MPFPPFDVLVGIEATDPGGFLDLFDTDGESMLAALGSGCLPCRLRSARCNARNKSVQVPYASQAPKMREDRLPRGKVGWEIAPRATRAQHIENRIKNGSQGVHWRSATLGLRRQMALQILPLCIRKIAGIIGTHLSSLSCEVISAINKTRSKMMKEIARVLLSYVIQTAKANEN
jgi:hypothetical protein